MAEAVIRQPGLVIDITAGATIASGEIVAVSGASTAFVGVALRDAVSGDLLGIDIGCVADVACKASDDIAAGDKLYFDESENEMTLTSTSNIAAGYAIADAGVGVATVRMFLRPA